MRQIKFRGKSIETGQWVYGSLLQMQSGSSILVEDIDAKLYDEYKVIPETIGQFTGLKAKNGEEIYEGDILEVDYFNQPAEVQYIKDSFMAAPYRSVANYLADVHRCCYVIGNIHDNPELLKMK